MAIKIIFLKLFKSAETLKPLWLIKDADRNRVVVYDVPMQIDNVSEAKKIAIAGDLAKHVINSFTSSNGLLMLIIGGSMEKMFGLIRAMQMIVLSNLIKIPLPIHAFLFMVGAF